MRNLIGNAGWSRMEGDFPLYFPCEHCTYAPRKGGGRVCMLSQPAGCGREVFHTYVPLIPVRGRRAVRLSYIIRAKEADNVVLWADFFDTTDHLVESARREVTRFVTPRFARLSARFPIPRGASYVQLSLRFAGKIEACSFLAPIAYFC